MTDTEKKSKDLSHLHVGDNIKNMHLEAEGLEGLIVDLAVRRFACLVSTCCALYCVVRVLQCA